MIPVHIGRNCGWFNPARGKRGVLMCSAVGYEELGSHRGWRVLAETLALAGMPTLRFDYPGTGDSDGVETDRGQLASWLQSIADAIAWLKTHAGVEEVAVVGLRLGATLAALACEKQPDIHSLVLMAPVLTGRSYIREMKMLSRMLLEPQGITASEEPGGNGFRVGGFLINSETIVAVENIKLSEIQRKPAKRVLVLQQQSAGLTTFIDRLAACGAKVEVTEFDELTTFVCDPIQSKAPVLAAGKIVEWLSVDLPVHATATVVSTALSLQRDMWREQPVALGSSANLFGIMCQPTKPVNQEPAVLFVNGGMNSHIGWGRQTVEIARHLANSGVASLRMDMAGIGESGSGTAEPRDILYAAKPLDDITCALDWLQSQGYEKPAVVGSCSGAYFAFQAGISDDRVGAMVMINLYCFNWESSISFEEGMRRVQTPMQYVRRLSNQDTLRRLFSGDTKIAKNVIRQGVEVVAKALREAFGPGGVSSQVQLVREQVYRFLARGGRVAFVYGSDDAGRSMMMDHFGDELDTHRHRSLSCDLIQNSDHDISSRAGRDDLMAVLVKLLS